MIKNIKIFIMILGAYCLNANILFANSKHESFQVKSVSGSSSYFSPWKNTWLEIQKGDMLERGSLIYLDWDSGLTFELAAKELKPKVLINLQGPLNFRLNRSNLRRISKKKYSVNLKKEDANEEEAIEEISQLTRDLQDAWYKIEAYSRSLVEGFITSEGESPQVGVYRDNQTIQLFLPIDKTILKVGNFPYYVDVLWHHKKLKDFYLYVWRSTGIRDKPYTKVSGFETEISIPRPGRYFFQVSDLTKDNWSKIHEIRISQPDNPKLASQSHETNQLLITPIWPTHHTYIYTNNSPQIKFLWKGDAPKGAIIVSENQEDQKQYTTVVDKPEIILPFGEYLWWIEVDKKYLSEAYRFHIVPDKKGRSLADKMVRILNQENDGTFVVEPFISN